MSKQTHKFNDVHKGFPVPETIDPEDRLYVCLPVPNEPTHISNFLGALFELMRWTNYRRTNDTRGKQTADVWRDIWEQITFSEEGCDMCCDDQITLLNQILGAQRAVQAAAWRAADDGTPQSFAPDAPEDWDTDPSDSTPEAVQARSDALCAAVTTYAVQSLSQMAQSTGITAVALAGLSGLLPGWGLGIAVFTLVGAVGLIAALSDLNAVREVICCMLDALRGNECDLESFQQSLNSCDGLSANGELIRSALNGANANPDNYRAFTSQLGSFYSAAYSDPAGVPDCTCCEINPDDVIWWDNGNPYYAYTEPVAVVGETDRYLVTSVAGLINGGSAPGYIMRFAVDPAQCYRLGDVVIEGISGSGYAARFDCDMVSHEGFIPASNPIATGCGKYWIAESNTPWTLKFTITPECCE